MDSSKYRVGAVFKNDMGIYVCSGYDPYEIATPDKFRVVFGAPVPDDIEGFLDFFLGLEEMHPGYTVGLN